MTDQKTLDVNFSKLIIWHIASRRIGMIHFKG